jgi:hypothetical protein
MALQPRGSVLNVEADCASGSDQAGVNLGGRMEHQTKLALIIIAVARPIPMLAPKDQKKVRIGVGMPGQLAIRLVRGKRQREPAALPRLLLFSQEHSGRQLHCVCFNGPWANQALSE